MSNFPIPPNPRRPPDRPPDQSQNEPREFVRLLSEFPSINNQRHASGQPSIAQPGGQPVGQQQPQQLEAPRATEVGRPPNPGQQQVAGQQHYNQGYNYPMNPGIPPGFPGFGSPGFPGFGFGPYPFYGGFPGQMGGPNPQFNNQPSGSQPQGSSTQEVPQLAQGKNTSRLVSISLEYFLATS
jgi:hypothetical protein